MKDKKFKIMVYLGLAWLAGFLLPLRIKAPFLRGIEELITVIGIAWFAYWTVSEIRSLLKKETPVVPQKETNAKAKNSPK